VALDDSLLTTMATASVNASVQVIAMFPGRAVGQEYVDDISSSMGRPVGDIKVMNKKATSLTIEDLKGRKVPTLRSPSFNSLARLINKLLNLIYGTKEPHD